MNPDTIYLTRRRETSHAYLWWLFLGAFGAHQFYLGRIGWGVAYLVTLGFLGIGVLVDLFAMPSKVRKRNHEVAREVYGGQVPAGVA